MGREFGSSPPQGGSKSNINTKQALDYLMVVKRTFEETPDLYDEFLAIMKDFKSFKISVQVVKDKVLSLFNGHDNLLVGFNMFLPEGYKIRIPVQKIGSPVHKVLTEPVKPPVEMEEALSFVNLVKTRFSAEPNVYNSFLHILNLYKTHHKSSKEVHIEVGHLFEEHPDLHDRFLRFLPSGDVQQTGSFRREDLNSDITFQIPHPVKNERTSKDSEVCDHSDGIEKESDPVSKKQQMWESGTQSIYHLSDEDKETINDEKILDFFKRVRERLEPGAYQDFLKCVDLQRVGAFTTKSLEMLASGIFVDYPDLVDGFKEIILTHGDKNGVQLWNGEDGVSDEETRKIERERLERRTRTPFLAKEKYNLCKPVSELDLSNCKQCTPSYRLLPEYYPVPPATHRTDFEKSVLNDTWVSVTSGSEDYSFKHMRKNQYEESLFRCEDDRFELDMLVRSVKSAIKRIEKMMKKMDEGSMDMEEPIEIEDHLTSMNLRCIEKLYGDHGLDAMEMLRRKPEAVLPVVLDRLKLKLEQWYHCRTEFNKVWADVYAKNYHKSLDHRSFYFKQQDMKNLSSKALQAEINEKHEKNLGEDANLIDIGAKFVMSGTPDIEYDFLDSDLHEDLYEVIRYSCSEVFSAEQTRKFLGLWTVLLEHFLGVSNQHQKSEVALEELKSTSQGHKACIVLVGGSAGSEAVADKSSKTASPGASDVPGPPSEAQRRGVSGFICNTGVTVEAVARHLSGSNTSAPSEDGKKRPRGSNSPKVDKEDEREEGEILPEPVDSDEETSVSSGAGNRVQRREELSGSTDKDENEEDEGELDHQEKMESEGEADTWGIVNSPSSHNFTAMERLARPLAKHWTGTYVGKENRVFYGNGHFYVLFRLHQTFYERMLSAKNNSIDEGKRQMSSMGSSPDLYSRFKRALYNLLNGSSDSAKFEDECRATCGTHSYVLFTLDKLIFKIIKQLQAIESDAIAMKLIRLYNYEKSRKRGSIVDHVYYENARAVVHDDAIYRFESGSNMTTLAIQLMDVVPANLKDPKFCEDQWKDDFFLSERKETEIGRVYLKRCMQKQKSHNGEELDGIRVQNGLEYKFSGATCKVDYVLDTEDFMYRKSKRRRQLLQCDVLS